VARSSARRFLTTRLLGSVRRPANPARGLGGSQENSSRFGRHGTARAVNARADGELTILTYADEADLNENESIDWVQCIATATCA